MINTLNRQIIGTGGGGASASIYVTGLQESDSVTMSTPSGGTVVGVWDEVERYVGELIPIASANTPQMFSDSEMSGYQMYKAFDNNDATYFGANNASSPTSSYLGYDFGAIKKIESVHIVVDGRGYAIPINIQYNLNGEWVTYSTVYPQVNVKFDEVVICNFKTDKIRLECTRAKRPSDYTGLMVNTFSVVGSDVVPCFRLLANEYGMHTITATNGTKTSTEEVLVDALMDYWVEMDYKLWLYKSGKENALIESVAVIAGGTVALATITKNIDFVNVAEVNGRHSCVFFDKTKVWDLSQYTKFCVELDGYIQYSYSGISLHTADSYTSGSGGITYKATETILYNGSSTNRQDAARNVYICDISAYNSGYLFIKTSGLCNYNIYNAWLE